VEVELNDYHSVMGTVRRSGGMRRCIWAAVPLYKIRLSLSYRRHTFMDVSQLGVTFLSPMVQYPDKCRRSYRMRCNHPLSREVFAWLALLILAIHHCKSPGSLSSVVPSLTTRPDRATC